MANDETSTPRPGPDSEGYPGERPSADEEIVGSETTGDGELDEEEFDDEDVDDEMDEEESEPE